MKKLKIYLDTSVISFHFADDAPEYRDITIDFFKHNSRSYDLFISDVVMLEINANPDLAMKRKMLDLIRDFKIKILEPTKQQETEIQTIAERYIKDKIIPQKKKEDAYHIAFATCFEIEILLSWNFKHLANVKKNLVVIGVNRSIGYTKDIRLCNPLEVMDEE
ncbi:MAG: PIN domain-containing protein [Candidatus Wallbacteria bacterium]|nr:PIN domain-containing protein [Candidatus Wallbacteria bacterium]